MKSLWSSTDQARSSANSASVVEFRNSGATAVERSEIREIPADLLIKQIRSRPDALMELLGELSGRLAAAHGELQALLSQTVLVRLGTKLLDLVSRIEDWQATGWTSRTTSTTKNLHRCCASGARR